MKKKLKDLTHDEMLKVCEDNYYDCVGCPLNLSNDFNNTVCLKDNEDYIKDREIEVEE